MELLVLLKKLFIAQMDIPYIKLFPKNVIVDFPHCCGPCWFEEHPKWVLIPPWTKFWKILLQITILSFMTCTFKNWAHILRAKCRTRACHPMHSSATWFLKKEASLPWTVIHVSVSCQASAIFFSHEWFNQRKNIKTSPHEARKIVHICRKKGSMNLMFVHMLGPKVIYKKR
jgi:hypothetical protein